MSPCPLLADISSVLSELPPPGPCSPWGMSWEVVDDLSINLSAWGLMVRWRLSGPCSCQMGLPEPVGEGGQQESLLQGLEAALPSLGLHSPCLPPATLWAAFFTTSGYRTLHEFRSQWNYFRILVNRKLRVFLKLSITAVRWAEHGLGAVTDARGPVHCLGGAVPQPWQHSGFCRQTVCFSSLPPINLAGIRLRRGSVWLDPDVPKLCHQQGLRDTGLLLLIKGGREMLWTCGTPWANTVIPPSLSWG